MPEFKKILQSNMKVRFHDCDPFNHLNNSRYIDYIIAARGDQLLENYGLDIYKMARQQGIGWVTAQTEISYLSPATLMEEVVIETQLLSFGARSLLFEARMWNDSNTELKAVLWGKLVHFNLLTQKSQQHTDELMNFFSEVVSPLPEEMNFESRVKSLKQNA
ncbi:MAG: acyl-CoA thioesterase [Sphingobacteriales bacterium]|nr:acyl-CoA thioesterase [Sphingobacteriales bacterium]